MDSERKYWDAEAETMPRAKQQEVQLARLRAQMRYAYEHSSLHRRVWDEAGVTPDQITTIEDFQRKARPRRQISKRGRRCRGRHC